MPLAFERALGALVPQWKDGAETLCGRPLRRKGAEIATWQAESDRCWMDNISLPFGAGG